MITVIYDGNLGNNLFQYAFAYLLAKKLKYKLNAKPIPGFPFTYEPISGLDFSLESPLVIKGQDLDIDYLLGIAQGRHIILMGYFQSARLYYKERLLLKKIFAAPFLTPPILKHGEYTVVVMRRGKDYIPRHGLPYGYYRNALSLLPKRPIYICTDETVDWMVTKLASAFNATILPTNKFNNLNVIVNASSVVLSNSSFAWWGAFLSDSDSIIFPKPLLGFWSKYDPFCKQADLFFGSNCNKVIPCSLYTPQTFTELKSFLLIILKLFYSLLRSFKSSLSRRHLNVIQFIFTDYK